MKLINKEVLENEHVKDGFKDRPSKQGSMVCLMYIAQAYFYMNISVQALNYDRGL